MAMKEVELLKAQIDKLQAKDFDLEAWKKYTIIMLARIFGENTQKISRSRVLNTIIAAGH